MSLWKRHFLLSVVWTYLFRPIVSKVFVRCVFGVGLENFLALALVSITLCLTLAFAMNTKSLVTSLSVALRWVFYAHLLPLFCFYLCTQTVDNARIWVNHQCHRQKAGDANYGYFHETVGISMKRLMSPHGTQIPLMNSFETDAIIMQKAGRIIQIMITTETRTLRFLTFRYNQNNVNR